MIPQTKRIIRKISSTLLTNFFFFFFIKTVHAKTKPGFMLRCRLELNLNETKHHNARLPQTETTFNPNLNIQFMQFQTKFHIDTFPSPHHGVTFMLPEQLKNHIALSRSDLCAYSLIT